MTPKEMIDYHTARIGEPFVWGKNCCSLYALKYLDTLMAGVDGYESVTHTVYGQFFDDKSAQEFYSTFPHPWPIWAPTFCDTVERHYQQPGDIILAQMPDETYKRTHVCAGRQSITVSGELGVHTVLTKKLMAECEDILIYRPRR